MIKNFILNASRTRKLLVGCVLTAAVGGGTAAAAALDLSPFGPDQSPPSAGAVSQTSATYPVLAQRQQASDLPPSRLLDPYVASQGGTLANTRRALVTSRGESLYLVPANGSICMMSSDDVVQGCGQFPSTNPSALISVESVICSPNLPSNEIEVAAIMPPGASNVQTHYSDGSSAPLQDTNGVVAMYVAQSGPLPQSISWTGPQGSEQAGSSVPPDATSGKCAANSAG